MLPFSENGLRCIALDRRAHGHSDDPGRGYDFDTLADDLAVLLTQETSPRPTWHIPFLSIGLKTLSKCYNTDKRKEQQGASDEAEIRISRISQWK